MVRKIGINFNTSEITNYKPRIFTENGRGGPNSTQPAQLPAILVFLDEGSSTEQHSARIRGEQERGREREREGGRERERQTERGREREKERKTETERGRERERKRERQGQREKERVERERVERERMYM